jgi:hypothetical protein
MICTVLCGGDGPKFPNGDTVFAMDNRDNKSTPCQVYQTLLEAHKGEPWNFFVHDDLIVHDPDWRARIDRLFENPNCVAAGFGGALALGNRDLYRKPYRLENLARIGYASNQDDAEIHGERFAGDRRVAVPEQFAMAVRTEWLLNKGGWPVDLFRHHFLDGWLACEAARDDKEIWMCGVSCLHLGGGTSAKPIAKAGWLAGGTLEEDHQEAHRVLFSRYRDVLPVEIGL